MNIAGVSASAYQRVVTGKQINSAADNAAGLSIANKMDSQIQGMDQNVQNIGSMNDLAKTAEGALSGINDNLSRIRELAVQASNGILSDGDKSVIQSEISQLLEGIKDIGRNTEFNTMKLLDGSFTDKNAAMNPDGSGKTISIASATLENLGIEGFDVTGSFDISKIDQAMSKVNESRSNLGSVSNAFEHATNNVKNAALNLTNAKSQIEDSDIALEISNLKKQQILEQYQMFTQQAKAERQRLELGGSQDIRL